MPWTARTDAEINGGVANAPHADFAGGVLTLPLTRGNAVPSGLPYFLIGDPAASCGECKIQAGLRAGLDRTPLGGDGFCAAGVVALSQLRDPARGAPDAARRIGGARALRDQVEGAPARLLLRLTALPVTPRVRRSLNAA